MAERIGWMRCAAAALLAVAGAALCAQSPQGSLAGKLTDAQSHPLAGAVVTVRNQQTGAAFVTRASRNGSYEFTALGAGDYTLEASSPAQGRGEVGGIVVSAGHAAHVSAALVMEPAAPAPPAEAAIERAYPWKPAEGTLPSLEQLPAEPKAGLAVAELEIVPVAARSTPESQRTAIAGPSHGPAPELQPDAVPVTQFTLLATESIPLPGRSVAVSASPRPSIAMEVAAVSMELPLQRPATVEPAIRSARVTMPRALPSALLPSRMVLASPLMVQVAIGAARSVLRMGMVPQGSLLAADRAGLASISAPDAITAEQLALLPLQNRDWQSLLSGEDPDAANLASQDRPVFTGTRQGGVTVNGMPARLSFGAASGRGNGDAMLQGPILPESAIRAVNQVMSAGQPGEIRLGSESVQIGTKQGSAGRHGQVALFNRQDLWNASNPYSEWMQETAPASQWSVPVFIGVPYTPPDRYLRWETSLGDKIRYGRVGWYAAVEGTERNFPVVATTKHPESFFAQPTNDQMQVLAARLGLSSTDPIAEGVAAHSSMLESLNGLMGRSSRTSSRISVYGRTDWRLAERQQITVQGSTGLWNSPGGGFSRAEENYGTHSLGSSRGTDMWLSGQWQAFATPNLMAVTQGQMRHYRHRAPAGAPSAFEEDFNINTWGQLPQMVVDSRYGFTIGNPSRFGPGSEPDETTVSAAEHIDWAHGKLQVQAGFELSHGRDGDSLLRNRTGTYHYTSVENFVSDALAFLKYGIAGQLDSYNPHNCDETGRAWRDADGQLHGLGALPCYSYYSQTIGPSNWWVSTNEWAGYASTRWQPARRLNATAHMRWQMQQLPQPIGWLDNPSLPLTQRLPKLGSEWTPGFSLSWGSGESWLPVVHAGYSMFYGRIPNTMLLSALTETGSPSGDLKLRMRPTDNLALGGAPPFPYVLAGSPGTAVKPSAVEFAPEYKNGEVHEAAVSLEEALPGRIRLKAAAAVSLGRRLPVTADVNFDPALNPKTITYAVVDGNGSGPLKSSTVTVPFYANWPSSLSTSGFAGRLDDNYQQITEIYSRANSKWQAASLQLTRNGRGFTLHARYTYAHTADWNPLGSGLVSSITVFDPTDFSQEYGASDLDVRHTATGYLLLRTHLKLHGLAARAANGWALAATGTYRSGLPYTMHTAATIPREYLSNGAALVGLATGMNGYGGENRVNGVGRNTYRYVPTWKADARLTRSFDMGPMRRLQVLAESFNLFNHLNVTELETVGYTIQSGTSNSLPALTFLTGLKSGQTEFGQPLNVDATDFYRPRQIQFGLRFSF